MPEWLFKKLRKERGSDWVYEFSKACLDRPKTWYRTETESFVLEEGYKGNEPTGFVQDISNQKLVSVASAMLKKRFGPHPKILDLCSAPGGKSLGLAFDGFSVLATDADEVRLGRVHENRSRLKLESKITIEPIEAVTGSDQKFDLIWIDAPCSSTGIIRRHPEIKWNRTEADIEKLVTKQQDLIEWAQSHLNPNGVILYSTCSVLKSENTISNSSLHAFQSIEWDPQTEPKGDGIVAQFLEKKA